MRKPKILEVNWEGSLDFRRVHPTTWDATRKEVYCETGKLLPTWDKLRKEDREELRVLLSPLEIAVTTDEGAYRMKLSMGFMTDFMSVPPRLRSIYDNDRLSFLLAALFHDGSWAGHWFSFELSNYLFLKILKHCGVSWCDKL